MSSPKVLALLTVVGGLSALAIAQPQPPAQPEPPEKALRGGFDRPLNRNGRARPDADARPAGGRSTMSMTQSDGKDTVSIRIDDDEISAEVNGKPVPKERIRRHEDSIEILDDHGEVTHTINVALGTNGEMRVFDFGLGDQPPAPPAPGNPPQGARPGRGSNADAAQPGNRWDNASRAAGRESRAQPRVMMGITMSDADPRVVVGGGILLDSVVEGLGASKAGLQKDDLIVEIEGTRPISQDKLRDLLHGKKPGDELKVKFTRQGGKETEATIKLEAFDPKKLGIPEASSKGAGVGNPLTAFRFGGFDHEELHKALTDAIGELRSKVEDSKELREKVAQHLEKALQQLDAQRKQIDEMFGQLGGGFNQSFPRVFIGPDGKARSDGGTMIFRPGDQVPGGNNGWTRPGDPPDAQGGNDPFAGAADRLAEKLDRLNRRLDELEKRLNDKK